ncbi:putative mediator of RNA polymerase II transcription subunit 12 [Armigeres subalbatus]|uniref:putative mediator of RNA polymerase II transcription subunit 12 n=1 Tax=Armigeres subalbatus TaxID=124917 RepID=UPI002ED19855
MSNHSTNNHGDSCAGCNQPNESDNLVQCDACDAWWHFGCAGVTGSIADRSWMCTKCKRPSRASSKASNASRTPSLTESMARLRERQELEKQRAEVDLEKRFLQQQRELLEASIAAEEERRSQVSHRDSQNRVVDWIENSADPKPSAAGINQLPAASVEQQQKSHSGSDLQHSSPLRDRTIPAFDTTDDSLGPPVVDVPRTDADHQMAMGLIHELRVRLERCLQQSEPTSPQLADLQQQLEICRGEIEGIHRLSTAPTSYNQVGTKNVESTISNRDGPPLIRGAATLGAIPKPSRNVFPTGKCHASENTIPQTKSYPTMQIPLNKQQRIPDSRSKLINDNQVSKKQTSQCTSFLPAIMELAPPPQPSMQVQQQALQHHSLERPPVQQLSMQPQSEQQLELQPSVKQYSVQKSVMQQSSVRQLQVQQPLVSLQIPVHQLPVQQPQIQQSSVQQPQMQQSSVQQPQMQQSSVQQPQMQQSSVQQPQMQQPSVQQAQVQQSSVQQFPLPQIPVPQSREQRAFEPQLSVQQPSMSDFPIPLRAPPPNRNEAERGVELQPTQQQLASRQSLARDLPMFSGDPAEWPIFISNFEYTTRTCGYTHGETQVALVTTLKYK